MELKQLVEEAFKEFILERKLPFYPKFYEGLKNEHMEDFHVLVSLVENTTTGGFSNLDIYRVSSKNSLEEAWEKLALAIMKKSIKDIYNMALLANAPRPGFNFIYQ